MNYGTGRVIKFVFYYAQTKTAWLAPPIAYTTYKHQKGSIVYKIILSLSATIVLVSCGYGPLPEVTEPRPQPRSAAEISYIKAALNALQPRSIAENREYCGYFGLDPAGNFMISTPNRGDESGCLPEQPPQSMTPIASYHTHAAYEADYDSEVPSTNDLIGDISEGVDGYIVTPGGRLWFNNARARTAIMLCDLGCLIADPAFLPDLGSPVQNQYTLAELEQRQS